ncbi:MAG: glycosyltransferase [Eubacterium sp.]
MKKVLFLIPTLGQGGAEKVLVNLVNNMDKEKFDITVQTLFDVGVNKQFLHNDIKYKSYYRRLFPGNSKYFCLFSPEKLFKKFIKEHYDIIVSYLEGPTARIASGCTDKSTKLVSWIHCRMENERAASVGFRNFNEAKTCYEKFDYTACVSKWVKEYFEKIFVYQKPIGIMYNTIETEEIIQKSNEAVDEVQFSKDCYNICSVGKITQVKGFDRLARIHKKLLDEGIKNHIYIFGIGEDKEKLQSYLAENNLQDTFTFMGYNTNPYKYVKKCDLYICSSHSEGFSTSVTESLIVGTPVVTTLCSGMQEMLGENSEYGIVTENDEKALYQGVKRMLTEKGLLEHYAKQANERGEFFNTNNTTKAVEEMLESL